MTNFEKALEIIDRITAGETDNRLRLTLRNMIAIFGNDDEYKYGFTSALYLTGKITLEERDILRTASITASIYENDN